MTAPAFLQRNDNLFARVIDWNVLNSPNTDFTDEGTRYRLRILAPGITRKDISIEIEDRIMKVSGPEPSGNTHHRATFTRSFLLPWNADATNIKAQYLDGIIIIDVGKVDTWVSQANRMNNQSLSAIDRVQKLTKGLWSRIRSIT